MSDELFDLLERAEKHEILTIITMSLQYFVRKYGYTYKQTIKLVEKGFKEIERIKGDR